MKLTSAVLGLLLACVYAFPTTEDDMWMERGQTTQLAANTCPEGDRRDLSLYELLRQEERTVCQRQVLFVVLLGDI